VSLSQQRGTASLAAPHVSGLAPWRYLWAYVLPDTAAAAVAVYWQSSPVGAADGSLAPGQYRLFDTGSVAARDVWFAPSVPGTAIDVEWITDTEPVREDVSTPGPMQVEGNVGITGTATVSVSGNPTVNIANGQTVGISGTPAVTISGNPTVNLAGGTTVAISGTPAVTISGSPTVAIASGQSIAITGSPTVNIASGQSIAIAGTPAVTISGTPTVNLASGTTVTISGTPAVTISGSPTVNLASGTTVNLAAGTSVAITGTTDITGPVTIQAGQQGAYLFSQGMDVPTLVEALQIANNAKTVSSATLTVPFVCNAVAALVYAPNVSTIVATATIASTITKATIASQTFPAGQGGLVFAPVLGGADKITVTVSWSANNTAGGAVTAAEVAWLTPPDVPGALPAIAAPFSALVTVGSSVAILSPLAGVTYLLLGWTLSVSPDGTVAGIYHGTLQDSGGNIVDQALAVSQGTIGGFTAATTVCHDFPDGIPLLTGNGLDIACPTGSAGSVTIAGTVLYVEQTL
jgi:hypothetical protein